MDTQSAQALFERYFWPHYPPDAKADLARLRETDVNPAQNPALLAHAREGAELFASNTKALLGLEEALTLDELGVLRLARALDRSRRDRWLEGCVAEDPSNVFFNAVVHAALFVGESAVRAGFGRWSLRRPLWESVVVRLVRDASGELREQGAVAPFHWLLRHLSDPEIDDGTLAWRWRVHLAQAAAAVESLPVLATPRAMPPLRSPTYDLLVKYLHQRLPDLKDLGRGFPSPAEFTDFAFERLSFEVLHGGRVLAIHGQAPAAGERPAVVQVLWLTAEGFDHADTIPTDGTPSYFGRAVTPTLLELTLPWKGRPITHRIGFRGHQ